MDKCTILLEDTKSELSPTKVEPGRSSSIETKAKKNLSNCFPDELSLYDANIMNAKLDDLNFATLSQKTYDHGSDLLACIKAHTPNHLIFGNVFFLPKYAKNTQPLTHLGCRFDKTAETFVKFGFNETLMSQSSGPKISEALNRTKRVFSHNITAGDIIKL